ncbi:hypothetical protein QE152_g36968 [Popillia japonica]|uniref:Retrotransposon gag domain-containing protein n=1 Tax=Popillia japonica TaxID=7064 RepID=A0AAW1IBW5_POPJA
MRAFNVLSFFGANSNTSSPGAKANTSSPDAKANTSSPGVKANTSSPGAKANTSSPDAKANTSSPGVKANTSSPDAKANTSSPGAKANTSSPGAKANTSTSSPDAKANTSSPGAKANTSSPGAKANTSSPDAKANTSSPGAKANTSSPSTKTNTSSPGTRTNTASPPPTADKLAEALRMLIQVTLPPRPEPPRPFGGTLSEDPLVYLARLAAHTKGGTIHTPEDVDDLVRPYLTGEATRWYQQHEGSFMNMGEFSQRFKAEFLSSRRRRKLREAMEKQQDPAEPPAAFANKLRRLCLRFDPDWDEAELVSHIVERMTDQYCFAIAQANPRTMADLVALCAKWMDLFEREKPAAKPSGAAAPAEPPKTAGPTKSSGTGRPTTQTTRTDNQAAGRSPKCWFCPGYHLDNQAAGRSPKCWFCPGYHLNRDCSRHPQGFRDRHAAPKTQSGEE